MRVMSAKTELQCIKYSFIIPVKEINDYIFETVAQIQAIQRNDWELLVIPDMASIIKWNEERIQLYPSGAKKGPAFKRDYGAKIAKGEILVFLDDDSYPKKNILEVADIYFKNTNIIALGGPGITPLDNTFWQKVSGAVFLSKFSGGTPERYQSIGSGKKVFDWPSVNLMVRKLIFEKAGGFDSAHWPGEDSLFCQKLINLKLGDIYYAPEMVVWHHRRSGLIRHLKQIGAYALHRGYFAKKYRGNSLRILYFIPSGFMIFCLLSLILLPLEVGVKTISLIWVIYFLSLLISLINIYRFHTLKIAIASVPYIFLTHLWYGYNFIRGLLAKKIVSRLR